MIGLKGEKVILRPPTEKDFDVVYRLWNDWDVYKWSDDTYYMPRSPEKFKELFERYHLGKGERKPANDYIVFVIEVEGKVIGDCGLDIDWIRRRAKIWIELLPEEWGKGYGTDAIKTLTSYALQRLGLERVRAIVNGYNERSLSAFKKARYKEIARIPESCWMDGKWYDEVILETKGTD